MKPNNYLIQQIQKIRAFSYKVTPLTDPNNRQHPQFFFQSLLFRSLDSPNPTPARKHTLMVAPA